MRHYQFCCLLVPSYVSMFSPAVSHHKLSEIVHRQEMKVNWFFSAKLEFFNGKKRPRNRCKLQHFTPFKKDAKKWRENRENLVSNVETADPCLLKVRHAECWCRSFGRLSVVDISSSFRYKSFRNTFKVNFVSKVSWRKNQLPWLY